MIKVNVQDGVYLHNSGNFCLIEFGHINNVFGIMTTGTNEQGEEKRRFIDLQDHDNLQLLGQIIFESEYLGDL